MLGALPLHVPCVGFASFISLPSFALDTGDPEVWAMQIAWLALLIIGPILCWRGGRAAGVGGWMTLGALALSVALALAVTSQRPDEPLHANGHAWREAREVLIPWGVRGHGLAPFLHGKGGIALQWLVAGGEHALTGRADPMRISRLALAAAAGATAFLAIVLVQSAWAGLAAGCALAVMPFAQALAVSGSPLSIAAWILPWSVGLVIAAGRFGDHVLLLGAALAAGLGTLSHTAMLAAAPALILTWLIVARRAMRFGAAPLAALVIVATAWVLQVEGSYDLLSSRNQNGGLLLFAKLGMLDRNLLLDPQWTSPVVPASIVLWVIFSLRRGYFATMIGAVLATLIAGVPFYAVNTCSSDAVRYQGPLLGLFVSFAIAGLWCTPLTAWLGRSVAGAVRIAALAAMVALPLPAHQPPTDPVALEHQLVQAATRQLQPNTLVVLPRERFTRGQVIVDFPDFLLPEGSQVLFDGDPRIKAHNGPTVFYLGLACVSWGEENTDSPVPNDQLGLRPECQHLREVATPWLTRTLRPAEIPSGADMNTWTYHRLATDTPFGFFVPSNA